MREKCSHRWRRASCWSSLCFPVSGVEPSSFVAICTTAVPPRRGASERDIGFGAMGVYDRIADLRLEIESYELEGLERDVSSEFTRLSTVIQIRGGGEEGVGEDVTYDALDHVALQDAGPVLDLAGSHTIDSFCELGGSLDLFPAEPVRPVSRRYRRWAFESAALDLALRQAGTTLAEQVGRALRPLTFVVSLRLGDPPTMEPIRRRLDSYPSPRFKLHPTNPS